jgi:FkbM family methyltransferase
MATGAWEPQETALFLELAAGADLVINVGANVGYYCCLALQAGKRVLAFEPLPSNLKHLYENVHRNGWAERCEIYPVALGAANGLLELYGTGMGASLIKGWAGYATAVRTLVPVFTWDTLIGTRTHGRRCLVLVDVEGAEHQFLAGASLLLHQEPRPTWLMEIHSRHSQPAGVEVNPHLLPTFRRMWEAGYRACTADAERRELDEGAVIANANADLAVQKYDFLFV